MSKFRTTAIAAWTVLGSGFVPALQAQVVRQFTDARASSFERPRLSDDGTAMFVASTADLTGENPAHRWQLFRFSVPGGPAEQVTHFALGTASNLFGLSDDAGRIAFVSSENLTGPNADRSPELFVMDIDGSELVQLTAGTGSGNIGRVEMSGSGERIVFDANFDYGGLNPARTWQVFAVEADGTNLRRLSAANTGGWLPSISDDGQRVVYTDGTIQAVEASGITAPRALTSWYAGFPVISGDGSTVIFLGTGDLPNESGGWCWGGTQVGAVNWDGTNPTKLSGLCLGDVVAGTVYLADVTDDGQTIFYVGADLFSPVWRVSRDASQETQLATGVSWYGAACWRIGAAGGGTRIAFTCEGNPAGANSDHSIELFDAAASGAGLSQRTSTPPSGDSQLPILSRDSGHVIFESDANLLGEAPHPGRELYRASADGAGLTRLTDLVLDGFDPAIVTADGNLAVVPVGEPLGDTRRLYTANAQTGVVTAITPEFGSSYRSPSIDDAGSVLAAVDYSGRIYRMAVDGSGLAQLVPGNAPRLDGPGQFVVFHRSGQVRRMRSDGSSEQVLAAGSAPDPTRSGAVVAYHSNANPVGTNADGNYEIFSYNENPPNVRQLTFTSGSQNQEPVISGDGHYVYFLRTDGSYNPRDLARVDALTLGVTRVTTFDSCWLPGSPRPVVTNHDGSLAAFYSYGDCSGDNPDGNLEIFVVDQEAPWRLFVESDPPTRLRWEAAVGVSRYDVIRGDLAQLRFEGPVVDLGPVVCLHDDLPLATTAGDEDGSVPAPGAAFFYLVRGAPGDYGQASTGASRLPASGDCTAAAP